ncbi:MAG: acyltransferase family protein [Gemmatimonadales bacterium]
MPRGRAAFGTLLLGVVLIALQIRNGFVDDWRRPLMWGLPYAFVLAGALGLERSGRLPAIPALKLLGNSSYPLYLTHAFVLVAIRPATSLLPAPLAIAAAWAVCSALAVIVHLLVERPLQGRPFRLPGFRIWNNGGAASA